MGELAGIIFSAEIFRRLRRMGRRQSFLNMVGYSYSLTARNPWLGGSSAGGGTVVGVGAVRVKVDGLDWLARFQAGERTVTEEIYREFLDTVDRGVATVLQGADRETAVHEVFLRLITDVGLRQAFHGGDLGAWLLVIARNHAIDYARRRNRETPSGLDVGTPSSAPDALACRAEARLLLDRFWTELLPPKWRDVFEARFVRSLSQTEAATALGIRRTTLMYQELRIRQMLRAFLLEDPHEGRS